MLSVSAYSPEHEGGTKSILFKVMQNPELLKTLKNAYISNMGCVHGRKMIKPLGDYIFKVFLAVS